MEDNKVINGVFGNEMNDVENVNGTTPLQSAIDDAEKNGNTALSRTLGKKISVENFVKGVDRLVKVKTTEGKENEVLVNYIKGHINNEYVSYADKCDLAKRLIEAAHYISVGSGENEIRIYKQNSPALYMLKCLSLVDMYTDIEVKYADDVVEEFDMLAQRGLFDVFVSLISEDEIRTFDMVIDMTEDDILENERSVVGIVEGIKEGSRKMINAVLDGLIGELGKNGIDWKELVGEIVK
jgi:hypothetical protein